MPFQDALRQRVQPLTAVMTSNRIFLYGVFSTFALAATIANACRAHSNFYSVAIYLSKSSRSVLVLANFGFLSSLLFGRILQKLFFGPLQPREVERLYDQTWMFVTESLLAFTIFRDEFDVPFLLMFGFLLFVKCFHWLLADRVESIDQTTYPGPPTLFHIRMNALFCLLWAVDILMFAFAVDSTLTHGVGGMVLFASEYAILLATALNAILRYILSLLDLRRARTRGGENAPPWENKSMYIFYIELLTDFLKLATYMTFFMIILTFYGLPLNIIRDVFVTARSFITRLRALVRYHNATRDMDRRYPDATEPELAEMSDRTCIICREEMQSRNVGGAQPNAPAEPANGQQPQQQDGPNMTPKKLPCGHIFHFQCLRSWLERQQSCPTCRRTVLETNPQQAQNQAPGPGQPRAAAPRPGAAPAPGAPQGQQGAAGAGNPLGWVGRFFGVPPINGQFPGPQGQFAQGAAPALQQQQPQRQQQQGVQPNGAWGAAPIPGQLPPPPPPPFYDPVRGWQVQAPGHPLPPHLQPPPVFRGFYGPGQAWQPWGDPQWYAPQAQPPPVQQQNAQPPPHGSSPVSHPHAQSPPVQTAVAPIVVAHERQDHAPSQTPTPTSTTNGTASAVDSATETSADEQVPENPRAAAALAALRRRQNVPLTQSASSLSSTTVNASTSTARSSGVALPGTTLSAAPSSSEPPAQSPTSSASSSSSVSARDSSVPGPAPYPTSAFTPTPTSTSVTTAPPPFAQETPASSSSQHQQLPSLIPLYDTSRFSLPVPGANPHYAPYNHYYRAPAPGSGPAGPSTIPLPPHLAQTHTYPVHGPGQRPPQLRSLRPGSGSGSVPGGAGGSGQTRTPLSQLPPTLTDEQLARLDRLTREAIDERLRVLEGVSGAVYRCVEELTRVRSVLPSSVRRGDAGAQSSSPSLSPSQGRTSPSFASSAAASASASTSGGGTSAGMSVATGAKAQDAVVVDGATSSSEEEGSASASPASSITSELDADG
ncbi:hypothetical protein C8Q74DRAFT_1446840 [Fomes fomentarius]|nr:hypothetical protein C8Q74DRAFT_1446840 [Fomes fomentarius]